MNRENIEDFVNKSSLCGAVAIFHSSLGFAAGGAFGLLEGAYICFYRKIRKQSFPFTRVMTRTALLRAFFMTTYFGVSHGIKCSLAEIQNHDSIWNSCIGGGIGGMAAGLRTRSPSQIMAFGIVGAVGMGVYDYFDEDY